MKVPKPSADPGRVNARKLIDKDVLTMNSANSVNRAKNPMASRQKIANDRPLTFAKGGKVQMETKAEERREMKVDTDQDKRMIKTAFGQHDKQLHGGKKTVLKLAAGGAAKVRHGQASQSGAPQSASKAVVKKSNLI